MRNILYIIPIILVGCTAKPHSGIISKPADGQYAQGFTLCRNAEYTEIVIFDPWEEGRIMQKYYLAGNTALIPHDDGIKVKVPLHSLAATSCTHVGFLDAIGETHSLCGICSPYLVYTPIPTVEEGCADLGDAMQVNPERVILTHPDAVMISTYAQGDGVRQYFEKSSSPVIYKNEWTEQSPLARAELIRLIGAF